MFVMYCSSVLKADLNRWMVKVQKNENHGTLFLAYCKPYILEFPKVKSFICMGTAYYTQCVL